MHTFSFVGALALSVCVFGHPTEPPLLSPRRAGVDLERFRLAPNAEYVDYIQQTPISTANIGLIEQSYVETANQLVKETFPNATFRLREDHYVGDNGVAHVHFRQTVHDLDVDNADFNVNVGKDGKVFSYGNSFYTGPIPNITQVTRRDFIDPVAALRFALTHLQLPMKADGVSAEATKHPHKYIFRGTSGAVSDPKARLVYLLKPDGTLNLAWRVETDVEDNWLLSYVDAKTAEEVHGVVDYVSDATLQVYGWGFNDPTETDGRVSVTDPWDLTVSPLTWFGDGEKNWTSTRGNNGIAQENFNGRPPYIDNMRPDSPTLNFTYAYPTGDSPKDYINASVTQLFYTINTYHDLLYTLGFTEKAGNFQWTNRGLGGKEKDYVILNAQDGAGKNNADFAAPPDGNPGRMRMYMFTRTKPPRDAVFESGIAIHEYTHGLSMRLTGGPDNSKCLSAFESASMGEGWGDFMATAIRLRPNDTRATDYGMGTWVFDSPKGIRQYLFSTSMETNPLNYTSLNRMYQVHAGGTVWASMLYEVLWNLIEKHGKNDGPRPEFDERGVPKDGKYLAMKLVVDGMALQPCNPNFIQARDAILDADQALTGGQNKCEIWTGFAKRGLGQKAVYENGRRVDSYEIPGDMCKKKV
ncbi:extracellular metallo proteinase NpIII [Aspergillus pseudonomiae]|uniref:Extracellular metalloproteinase n=1 Tax=Aspergillus pseudonomiae TaxID=1506151 RepID=A0A5N6I7D9_9EURO|nr:extracellular metallo proteinase NpIII [Aspergillus pseudonomiae]KAB8262124.1 extracellular metallo proteinase NpIII [Aspergillus pseudonomiae]KAE8402703.1 extracellular metallo proteinase NpIII [Aspergillus pseudonomiae]